MENQTDEPRTKAIITGLARLHPYQFACMILSVIAMLGVFTIIFIPTDTKLNDGALALIGSIVSFWMGRMGGRDAVLNNGNGGKQ